MTETSAGLPPETQRSMGSRRRAWWTTLILLTVVFSSTAHWYGITNIDTVGAAWPAWHLVHHGTLFLEDASIRPQIPWFYESGGHIVSNRMAGVLLISVPAQVALAWAPLHPLAPAVLTAVLLTAAALANLLLILLRAGVADRLAAAVVAVLALGTGFWTNASAELWPHGPDAFWLSCAMLAAQRKRLWLSGLCLGPAIWTRPHLALVAVAIGLSLGVAERRLTPVLAVGLPTAAAAIGLVAWNTWYFGTPSIGGGYAAREAAVTDVSTSAGASTLASAAGSLFSPLHGLFVYSPFMLVAVIAVVCALRRSPSWAIGSGIGGVLYLLMQWRLNSFTGGTGLYGYRLQLETIVLLTPLATIGYARWSSMRPRLRILTRLLCAVAIGVHAIGVYWYEPLGPQGQELDPWRTWEPWYAATLQGPWSALLALVVVLLVLSLSLVRHEDVLGFRAWVNRNDGSGASVHRVVSAAAPS